MADAEDRTRVIQICNVDGIVFNNHTQFCTLGTVALVAVVGGDAVLDGGGGEQVGEQLGWGRQGLWLRAVGGRHLLVVLVDGQAEAKRGNGEEHLEEHHLVSTQEDLWWPLVVFLAWWWIVFPESFFVDFCRKYWIVNNVDVPPTAPCALSGEI